MSYYSSLDIKANFFLNAAGTPSNKLDLTDITNWAAEGISSGAGDTVKILLRILDPLGIPVYENTGYSSDDYSAPDITLTSADYDDTPLPTTGAGIVIGGTYTIQVKAEVTKSGDPPQYVQKDIQHKLCPEVISLAVKLSLTFDCDDATANGKDNTNYACDDYPTVSVTRTLTLSPPAGSGQSTATSSTDTVQKSDLLSPVTYDLDVVANVEFKTADNRTIVTAIYKGYVQEASNCDDSLCKMFCCLQKLETAYYDARKRPEVQALERMKLSMGIIYYELAKDARKCGHESKIPGYVTKFYEETGCDPKCDCCGDTPAPVIPKGDCSCSDGTDGREVEMQAFYNVDGNLVFQWRYVGVAGWTDLVILDIAALSDDIYDSVMVAVVSLINSTVTTAVAAAVADTYMKVYGVEEDGPATSAGSTWLHPVTSGAVPYQYYFGNTDVLSEDGDEMWAEILLDVNCESGTIAEVRMHIGKQTNAAAPPCSAQHNLNNAVAITNGTAKLRFRVVRINAGKMYYELTAIEGAGESVYADNDNGITININAGVACGYNLSEFDFTDLTKCYLNCDLRATTGDYAGVKFKQLSVYSVKKRQ